jgi:hypothetical protein
VSLWDEWMMPRDYGDAKMACSNCGSVEKRLAGSVLPLGSQPGRKILECRSCGHLTWLAVHRVSDDDPRPATSNAKGPP